MASINDLIIMGIGGFGRSAIEIAEAMNEEHFTWNILGFLDDNPALHDQEVNGYLVLGGQHWLRTHSQTFVVVCIGPPKFRMKVVASLDKLGHAHYATLKHPFSSVSKRSEIGLGSVISAGVIGDTNAKVGNHVLLGRNSSIGHDVIIGDYVNVSPGATITGHCLLGKGCDIGANATVIPGVTIDNFSIVGAGSVVNRSLPKNVTAVGVPARIITKRENDEVAV